MASYNRVVLAGNLTRDPLLKHTPSGTAVCELGLAISESFRNSATNEVVERVCFVDVEVWQRQAETCEQYLAKGRPVLVEGRLQMDRWKNKEGENRTKLKVRADRVIFLGTPARGTEFADGGGDGEEASSAHASGEEAPRDEGADTVVPRAVTDTGDAENLPF